MKLLVTGGAGYIGSHTAHQLIEAGHDVVVLDSFVTGHRWAIHEKAQIIEGKVGDRELLKRVFSEHLFDGVLHFAAFINVGESVRDPIKYYQNNVVSALELFSAAAKAGVSKLIFSSTAAVYGEPEEARPLRETDPLRPMNPYGASKLMSERILQDIARASSGAFRYVILRYFNAAGARLDGRLGQAFPEPFHLINIASEAALGARPKLVVYGNDYPTKDGTCERDYVHVEDLARAHVLALEYLEGGGQPDVFNVGYGHASSVLEVIQAFKKATGKDFPVEIGPRRPGDPSYLAADSRKIRETLGWEPKYDDLELICKTAFEWERIYRSKRFHGA